MHRLAAFVFLISLAASEDELTSSNKTPGRITPILSTEPLTPQRLADLARKPHMEVSLSMENVAFDSALSWMLHRTIIRHRSSVLDDVVGYLLARGIIADFRGSGCRSPFFGGYIPPQQSNEPPGMPNMPIPEMP